MTQEATLAVVPSATGARARGRAERRAVAWTAAACVFSLLALAVPVFAVDLPPVVDYPNHLARMWLIAGGAEAAPLSSFYAVDWSRAVTNIAIDLSAALVGPWLGLDLLGPMLLALSIVLPPLGAVALNRRLFGGWHWWQIGFAALGWSVTALLGFMNFQLGLGVALLAAAADDPLRSRGRASAVAGRVGFGAVLLLFHPFDVMFYAALLGGLSLGRRLPTEGVRSGAKLLARAVLVASPAIAPLALALLLAPAAPGAEPDGLPAVIWNPLAVQAALPLTGAVHGYGFAFDLPVLLAAVWIAPMAALRRRLDIHAGLLLTAGAIAAWSVFMPLKLGDTFYVSHRLPIMAWLLAAAAVRPQFLLGARGVALAGAGLLALTLARTGAVLGVWTARQADVTAVRSVLANVPEGATVLPVMRQFPGEEDRPAPIGRAVNGTSNYWHYATLAITERRAFVPTLFTAAGKQPVQVLAPYDSIDSPNAPGVALSALRRSPNDFPAFGDHLRRWRRDFDYVLVLNADLSDDPRRDPGIPGLQLAADTGFAQLFKVETTVPSPSAR